MNAETIIVPGIFTVLILTCFFVWHKLNTDVDALFSDVTDSRTQIFFMLFDNKPEPISVNQARAMLDSGGGMLEIEGLYSGRPIKVAVQTEQSKTKTKQELVSGHRYSMPVESKLKLVAVNKNGANPKVSLTDFEQVDGDGEVAYYTNSKGLLKKFLHCQKVEEYIQHMLNSSKVDELYISGTELTVFDGAADASQRIVRVKAIFEMQAYLACALEGKLEIT